MGPVLTIAFGIAIGLLFFILFIWLIALLAYLIFGNQVFFFMPATSA